MEQYQQNAVQLMGQNNPNMTLQIEPRHIIEDITFILQGKSYNADGEVIDAYNPIVNDDGINLIVATLRSHLNPAVVLANLTDTEINRMAFNVRTTLIELFYCNHDKFDLDIHHFNTVLNTIDHAIYCFLSRTKNDGERDFHKTIQKVNSIIREGIDNVKSSVMPSLGNNQGVRQ